MECLAISDLHGNLPNISKLADIEQYKYDVLIIAGDICPCWHAGIPMRETCYRQAQWLKTQFIPWVKAFKIEHILLLWGNHDFIGERHPEMIPTELKEAGITVLTDQACTINGVNFYGTPWVKPIGDWAFLAEEAKLKEIYSKIPKDTHVLILHGPPFGHGDKIYNEERYVGSEELTNLLKHEYTLPNLRAVVCGHVHEGHGVTTIDYPHRLPLMIYNVSILDHQYKLRHEATGFAIDPNKKWSFGNLA